MKIGHKKAKYFADLKAGHGATVIEKTKVSRTLTACIAGETHMANSEAAR